MWRPGEVLRDSHTLTISQDVMPDVYRLVVGMYRYPSIEPLGGPADIGLLAVKEPSRVKTTPPGDLRYPAGALDTGEVEFGERITLLGYDRELQEDTLHLTLYWQAERALDRNWTVFMHLLDKTGTLIAQHDSPPSDGRYPTSVWDQGEVVYDRHTLALPSGLSDGGYEMIIGLYSQESGERLPVLDGEGNPVGDSISLFAVVLADGNWQIN